MYKEVKQFKLSSEDLGRFFNRIIIKNGCWGWAGAINPPGYGKISIEGRAIGAHRVSFTAFKGAIPKGKVIDHLCRNRACVNPQHLRAVTWEENTKGAVYKVLKQCKNGHELTGNNLKIMKAGGRFKNGLRRVCRKCKNQQQRKYLSSK